jgi:hypothetical protein
MISKYIYSIANTKEWGLHAILVRVESWVSFMRSRKNLCTSSKLTEKCRARKSVMGELR